jgi:hypothetical protein
MTYCSLDEVVGTLIRKILSWCEKIDTPALNKEIFNNQFKSISPTLLLTEEMENMHPPVSAGNESRVRCVDDQFPEVRVATIPSDPHHGPVVGRRYKRII